MKTRKKNVNVYANSNVVVETVLYSTREHGIGHRVHVT